MFHIRFKTNKRGCLPIFILTFLFIVPPMMVPFVMDIHSMSNTKIGAMIIGYVALLFWIQYKFLSDRVSITPQGIREGKRFYVWNQLQKIQYVNDDSEEGGGEYLLFTFYDHKLRIPCDFHHQKQQLYTMFHYIGAMNYPIQFSQWTLQFKEEPQPRRR